MATFLIIPAAGSGSRLARPEPKALVPLSGRPMLSWTLEALAEVPFQQTVVAVPPDRKEDFELLLEGRALVVEGGETRSASVRAGFYSLRWTGRDIVCIHDAARPFVTGAEVARVIGEAERPRSSTRSKRSRRDASWGRSTAPVSSRRGLRKRFVPSFWPTSSRRVGS